MEANIIHLDHTIIIGQTTALTTSSSMNQQLCASFWQQFNQILYQRNMKQGASWVKYGCMFQHENVYSYACAIPTQGIYPQDFQLFKINRGRFLRFIHTGDMRSLPETIHRIWKEYVVEHDYKLCQDGLLYIERYTEDFHFNHPNSKIEILVPLVETDITSFPIIPAKSILQGSGSSIQTGYQALSWFGMDYNMNLYKGCCHGCIYCDSRSNCYQVKDFDLVRGKENEIALLQQELKRKRRKGTIGIGAMSDTYNPYEKTQNITRQALELIAQHGFGIGIDTKSDLILRDLDLLKRISQQYPSIIKITITCADDTLCKIIEPYVTPSSKRFLVLQKLHEEGIYAGILLMPILPFINDTEENIKNIVKLAHQHHAKFIYGYEGFGVTLRENQRDYFYYMLDQYFPGKRELYEKHYHNTYSCISPHARKLKKIFQQECERYHIHYRMQDIIKGYKSNIPNEQIQFKL